MLIQEGFKLFILDAQPCMHATLNQSLMLPLKTDLRYDGMTIRKTFDYMYINRFSRELSYVEIN